MRGSKRVFFLKTFCSGIHLYTFLDRQSQFWLRMDVDTVGKVFVQKYLLDKWRKKEEKEKQTQKQNQCVEVKFLFMTSSTLIEYFFPKINEIPLKKVY